LATQWIGELGLLDGIFSTPANHRVHHETNPEYIDKNYGNLLILWLEVLAPLQPRGRQLLSVY
jgi:sterol desaturase/sphingolipid hydroxylase (fatty acid hydroxylase superfamily)